MTYNDFLCCVMQIKSNTCFSITKATTTQPLSVKTSIEFSIVVHNTRKENGMLIGLIGNYMIGNYNLGQKFVERQDKFATFWGFKIILHLPPLPPFNVALPHF